MHPAVLHWSISGYFPAGAGSPVWVEIGSLWNEEDGLVLNLFCVLDQLGLLVAFQIFASRHLALFLIVFR